MIVFYAFALLLSGTVFGAEKGMIYHNDYSHKPKGYVYKSREETHQECMLFAIADNDIEEVTSYLSERCSINKQISYIVRCSDQTFPDMTPLMVAAFHDRSQITGLLLRGKVKLDLQNGFGDTALIIAARLGRVDIVQRLIKAGADVSIVNDKDENALIAANSSFLRWNTTHPEVHLAFNHIVTLLSPGLPKFILY